MTKGLLLESARGYSIAIFFFKKTKSKVCLMPLNFILIQDETLQKSKRYQIFSEETFSEDPNQSCAESRNDWEQRRIACSSVPTSGNSRVKTSGYGNAMKLMSRREVFQKKGEEADSLLEVRKNRCHPRIYIST